MYIYIYVYISIYIYVYISFYFLLHFTLSCFADIVFYKLKVCGNPASSKSIGAIFPIAFVHFTSLCHILVILVIFQTFLLLLCYGDL